MALCWCAQSETADAETLLGCQSQHEITMTRETAEKVVRGLLAATREVNDALFVMQPELPRPLYEQYKTRRADVLAAIYLDLIKPIVAEHPDLDPGLDEPR